MSALSHLHPYPSDEKLQTVSACKAAMSFVLHINFLQQRYGRTPIYGDGVKWMSHWNGIDCMEQMRARITQCFGDPAPKPKA